MSELLPDLRSVYVLLVDDDAEILEFTAGLFRMCGATVKAITGAPQALEVARQVSPHVVVTDIAMPGKDGYWLGDQLEASGLAAVPVIALTAFAV